MTAVGAGGFRVKHDIGPGIRAMAQVLLAEVLDVRLNRGAGLEAPSATRRRRASSALTSCSSNEIFCSFILWMPAWAEPARAAAATRALFIVAAGGASEVSEVEAEEKSGTSLL